MALIPLLLALVILAVLCGFAWRALNMIPNISPIFRLAIEFVCVLIVIVVLLNLFGGGLGLDGLRLH